MTIVEGKKNITIENIKDFDVSHIFDCGQCFRWNKEEDGTYTGVVGDKVINVGQIGSTVVFNNVTKYDYDSAIKKYFDLDTDYTEIKNAVNTDEIMDEAIKFGWGIRILNQDEWETMISFMISANNRIPMIKKVIENLSKSFGSFICNYKGKEYYAFPTAEQLSNAPLEKIQECKAGFRSQRIKEAATRFLQEKSFVYNIKNTSYDEG